MLEFTTPPGAASVPADAATTIVVRRATDGVGIEVFCVERNRQSRFMGGAIVFPGGKLDATDSEDAWAAVITAPRLPASRLTPFARDEAHFRALAIAAARETLEEACILPVIGGELLGHELPLLREALARNVDEFRQRLLQRTLRIDLAALTPFSRWVTPEAEGRRFDARFFVAIAPEGQTGAHDDNETTASFWAHPDAILARFDRNEIQLMPPTHRTLMQLAECSTEAQVLALASANSLEPICPRLVAQGDTKALVLPGDPAHEIQLARVPFSSRYVLRDTRWRAESPPQR
jgi:8-oxo-dGTP pyrophosphatase MutT (NUDIX family)